MSEARKPTVREHIDALDEPLRKLAEAYIEGTGVSYRWVPQLRGWPKLEVRFDRGLETRR